MLVMLDEKILHEIGMQEAVLWGVLCGKFYYGGMCEDDVEDSIEHIVNGFIKIPTARIEKLLGIKRVAQKNALKKLENAGLIHCRVLGMPATRHVCFTDDGAKLVVKTLLRTIKATSDNHFDVEL